MQNIRHNTNYVIAVVVFLFFALMLSIGLMGCIKGTQLAKIDAPKNPAVAKPNELYVAMPGSLARVSEKSPWFNRFWKLADNAIKADAGSSIPAGVSAFEMPSLGLLSGYNPKFTPNIDGFKLLKQGQSMKYPKNWSYLLLLYYEPTILVIANDKAAETHMEEVKQLGYPIEPGGIHWVRYVMFEPSQKRQTYRLFVNGTKPYWNKETHKHQIGTGFQSHFVDKNKLNLDRQLKSMITDFFAEKEMSR